ncbi:hypothetical protein PsorP6_010861 [Peronosclerospora sorghi]|uniref:Uncharacterized protein n=1 Tax=Peronosclerospora sorghi TaxID=230839 RepID=A0ACC0VXB2_9STRA|nr:hypothetical protein PsorP6_010861 [Peronosclerospora sorghi]
MELSAYETKRQRRVEENQRQLETLEIHNVIPWPRRQVRKKKRYVEPVEPVWRSLRQRHGMDREETKSFERRRISEVAIEVANFHAAWLGTPLWPRGKDRVMQGLCPRGVSVTFSYMSGVQAWKNAIVLFVNVDARKRPRGWRAGHVFSVVWTAAMAGCVATCEEMTTHQGRGRDATMEGIVYDDKKEEQSEEEPLLLFLRSLYLLRATGVGLGIYPVSRPIEFRWQLVDFSALAWEHVRDVVFT